MEYWEISFVQLEDWFTHLQTDQHRLMFKVVDISTSETVGIAGLTSIDFVNRCSDVHLYVGKEGLWIDHHLAPAALSLIKHFGFNTLNLHKLYAEIYFNDQKKRSLSSVMVSKKMEYCAIIIFRDFILIRTSFLV